MVLSTNYKDFIEKREKHSRFYCLWGVESFGRGGNSVCVGKVNWAREFFLGETSFMWQVAVTGASSPLAMNTSFHLQYKIQYKNSMQIIKPLRIKPNTIIAIKLDPPTTYFPVPYNSVYTFELFPVYPCSSLERGNENVCIYDISNRISEHFLAWKPKGKYFKSRTVNQSDKIVEPLQKGSSRK